MFTIHKKIFVHILFLGGLFTLLLIFGASAFFGNLFGGSRLDPEQYAPNFWFDSEEQYYPGNPLDFYYDVDLNELAGDAAVEKYSKLSLNEKLKNFVVFYDVKDSGDEWVYQYWLFYVFI